jgi:hypothetical protein
MRVGRYVLASALWLVAGCDDASPPTPTPDPAGSAAVATAQPGMASIPKTDEGTPPGCVFGPEVDETAHLGKPAGAEVEAGSEGFFATTTPAPSPRRDDEGSLLLTLEGPKNAEAGKALGLSLSIANKSSNDTTLMRTLDGSSWHWRFPTYDLYARDDAGKTYRWAYTGGRCGNVNPVVDDDFFALPAGRTHEVGDQWSRYRNATLPAGKYTIWMVYTMCDGSRKNSDDDRAAIAKRAVLRGSWPSNAVAINVAPPPTGDAAPTSGPAGTSPTAD